MSQSHGTHNKPGSSNGWNSSRGKVAFHTCRILLALIFITAAAQKIARPWDFGRAIYAYEFLNGFLISPSVIAIPWIEFLASILLLFNRFTRSSAIILGLMNITFIFAISSVIVRGMEIDCGCGLDVGFLSLIIGTQADGWVLVRDFIFLGMAVVAYLGYIPKKKQ